MLIGGDCREMKTEFGYYSSLQPMALLCKESNLNRKMSELEQILNVD